MAEKTLGHATVTYKVRLYDKHHNWLVATKELYNRVVWHYYEQLRREPQLLELSNFLLLRKAEERSVGTKETRARNEEMPWKLEGFPKIPLYFRRAAINAAIGLARSYQSLQEVWAETQGKGRPPSYASVIQAAPVFYKGMYKDFTRESITLKLFTGNDWRWITFRYTGRDLPEDGKRLSPVLEVRKKDTWLHLPVMKEVSDVRPIRERMKTETRILALCFPEEDCMAAGVILGVDGRCLDNCFFRGGAERKEKLWQQIQRLEKAKRDKNSDIAGITGKIADINMHYAHKISRQILNFALKNQISVIVVPNFEQMPGNVFMDSETLENKHHSKKQKDLGLSCKIAYQYVWIGRRIIRYLKYKAFQEGMLVGSVRINQKTDCCNQCGAPIHRYNQTVSTGAEKTMEFCSDGKLFRCENGHIGNSAWNEATNIGKVFLSYFKFR